jgi:hypothetical protein
MLGPVRNPGALAYDGLDASALEALRGLRRRWEEESDGT